MSTKLRDPNPLDPHYQYFKHIAAGGVVHRNDPLNKVKEDLTLDRLGGEAANIQQYGYQDLTIVDDR